MEDWENIARLTHRLEKLEKQSRILKAMLGVGTIGVSAALLMGQTTQPHPSRPESNPPLSYGGAVEAKIRAQEIALVDDKGKERASLVTDGNGSVFFVMFDANGRPRADLNVATEGPSLNFYDPNGKSRLIVGSTSMVGSHVASANGIVEKSPPSSIVMFDKDGKMLSHTP